MRVVCSVCGNEVPVGTLGRCPKCGGILQPEYPDDWVRQLATIKPGPGINRYAPLLPSEYGSPFLYEGDTPLIPSKRIGRWLGLRPLCFKHEGMNPTGSFKDRAAALAVALAQDVGAVGVVSASSGNASSAIAAYCAAAGLQCVILMEPGNPAAKLRQTLAYGARVVLVEGVFAHGPDALGQFLSAVAEQINFYLGFVWAPINPYILEGIKTISYEVARQYGGAPDVVVCPVGGGDLLAAQWRGYKELLRAGVIDRLPRMIGVQSESAPPLLEAVRSGAETVATLPYARSKISGINVPFTGDHALAAVRESGGSVVGISDEEAFAMQRRLAVEEGIWVEPAGAAPVAALARLIERGDIQKRTDIRQLQKIVCVMSGAGFKDANLAADAAASIGQQPTTPFDVGAVVEQIQGG